MAATSPRSWNRSVLAILIIVGLAMALGAGVRLWQVAFDDFPFNDGGMFAVMTQDLINAHFALPAHTTYNLINLPYAYSPLMFYVTAILSTVGHWPILEIIRFLPTVFSVLIIPVQYAFTYAVLKSHLHAIFATLIYALTPASFVWLISGGGLTRAPGMFFTLLALYQAYLMCTAPTRRLDRMLLTAVFATLALLCHPQMAWSIGYTMVLFFLLCGRNRRNLVQSLVIAVLMLVLSSPWWLAVAAQNGFSVFLSAFGTGSLADHISGLAFLLIGVGFLEQVFLGLLGMIIGTARAIAAHQFLLPAWLILTFVMEPRFFPAFSSIPLTILTAVAIVDVILPAIQKASVAATKEHVSISLDRRRGSRMSTAQLTATVIFFTMMFGQGIISALNITYISTISDDQRQALAWIAANTESDSSFAVLVGVPWDFNNFAEWFPALSQRHSIDTYQGREWLPNFSGLLAQYNELEKCLPKTIECVENWAAWTKAPFTYVVLDSATFNDFTMRQSLINSPNYRLIYETQDISIFRRTDF